MKIVASAGILLAGLLVAMLFRQPSPWPKAAALPDDQLVLRKHAESPDPTAKTSDFQPARETTATSSARPAPSPKPRALPPGAATAPLPDLAKAFPSGSGQDASRWGIPLGQSLAAPNQFFTPLKHRVVDGDSLPALAERYLGSPSRAMDIFEANRESLPSPQILPIGANLKIPPRDTEVTVASPTAAGNSVQASPPR